MALNSASAASRICLRRTSGDSRVLFLFAFTAAFSFGFFFACVIVTMSL
ncbi:hypothetical protein [Pseudoxanthomonas sacheonensis]|nr:hypothetical protein [Pseudoxanthomonas sacheonensis]